MHIINCLTELELDELNLMKHPESKRMFNAAAGAEI